MGDALDISDLAALAGEVLGAPGEWSVGLDEAYFTRMAAFGTPEPVVANMRSYYASARAGEFAAVDPTLSRLLGRAPTPMR